MFRNDRATIKRLVETKTAGEWSSVPTCIYSNIPCHLAVRTLNDVAQSDSIGEIVLDFQLFVDTIKKYDLQINDIAEVTTAQGQKFTLYVGEGFIYPLTSQYQLKRDKIV